MPGAVAAAVVGFIGLVGTPAAIATAVISTALTVGLSFGVSLLAQSLFGAKQVAPRPSDRQFIIKSSVQSRVRHYGRVRVAGTQIFAVAIGGFFYRVLAHGHGQIDGIEKYLIDANEVEIDGSGYVTTEKYINAGRSRIRIETRDGRDDPAHYASLGAVVPEWDEDHLGRGVFHSLTAFEQVPQDVFRDYFPQAENTSFKIEFRGARVYDPRTGATAWSENVGLCIRDLLTHPDGFGMPSEWVDDWTDSLDACDDEIPLKAGGTEPRYRVSLSYGFDQRPADVLQGMLTGCNGKFVVGDNGGLKLVVGVWHEPTFTITGAMIEGYALDTGNEGIDVANTIRAEFVSPDHGYVEQDADPWENAADVAARGVKTADIRLTMVPSHGQCRRLMKQAAAMAVPEWRGSLVCNLAALPVLSHRFVRIELPDIGETITAEIEGTELRVEADGIVTGVNLSFVSVSASAFAWDAATEEGRAPEVPPVVADDLTVLPPESFSATIEQRTSDATTYVVAVFSYVVPRDYYNVEIEHKTASSASWLPSAWQGFGTATESSPLVDGETYEFRARCVSGAAVSEWVTLDPIAVVIDTVAPSVPVTLATSAAGADVTVTWTQPASANTYGARVYRGTTSDAAFATRIVQLPMVANATGTYTDDGLAAGTYWWFVAAINGSGVESARVLAGTQTIT